jgi:hypothetical protein
MPRTLYAPPVAMSPTELMLYEQGSEACRNYSGLTSRARTFAQLIAVAAIGAPFASGLAMGQRPVVLQVGGAMLCVVAIGLGLIDWHYQSAFAAIRDRLANMEAWHKCNGPWRSHLSVRTGFADHIASYIPFFLLALLGIVGIVWGTDPLLQLKVALCLGIVYITCLGLFVFVCGKKTSDHKRFEEELANLCAAAGCGPNGPSGDQQL